MMKKIGALWLLLTLAIWPCLGAADAFPPAGEILPGIDVSVWQGEIDFARVRESDVQVVYIRSSEGSTVIDTRFRRNYAGFKAQGFKIGDIVDFKGNTHYTNANASSGKPCRSGKAKITR